MVFAKNAPPERELKDFTPKTFINRAIVPF